MGERNDLVVPLVTCNKILFHTIITTMFCLLKRVKPQPEIHKSGKGTVGVNQAGLGLSDDHLRAIIDPLIEKVGNFHKEGESPFHRSH